jgi:hypothetical protein
MPKAFPTRKAGFEFSSQSLSLFKPGKRMAKGKKLKRRDSWPEVKCSSEWGKRMWPKQAVKPLNPETLSQLQLGIRSMSFKEGSIKTLGRNPLLSPALCIGDIIACVAAPELARLGLQWFYKRIQMANEDSQEHIPLCNVCLFPATSKWHGSLPA